MPAEIKNATVQEAMIALEANPDAVLIDVREQAELDEIATTMAKFFPMSQLNPSTFDKDCQVRKDQPLYILCRSGGRSLRVAAALLDSGFKNVTNVAGGITAWAAAGLPLKK